MAHFTLRAISILFPFRLTLASQLLTTKFYIPPVRENLVPRAHLVERLHEGLKAPLTLVSAPAGYGKTTLLAEWHSSIGSEIPTAWLSLDAEDNDLLRFLYYLIYAIEGMRAGLVSNTVPLLQASPPAPFEAVLARLVNDLSGVTSLADGPSRDLVLVLDDYYLIVVQAIHEAVAFLLSHLPPAVHLVILTREDPPLPLAKLRARGEIHEMRGGDLRFSSQEGETFLASSLGLQLTEPAIIALMERTEGWVAGLQMAALAMTALQAAQSLQPASVEQFSSVCEEFVASFRGDDRYIMDFLMEEVIQRQPKEIQDFLLHTSILNRLCASLCEAVLGDKGIEAERFSPNPLSPVPLTNNQQILDYLERSNLFIIPLDNKREWYRYHHLFADLLQYRLQRRFPERLPELHRRAYHWYRLRGDVEEAMK
ncbi:MAG TPA: hypothetical protein VJ436_00575, partial [Anaerolineales bacterium]|nr:hypothetical protein [Anaerolineales bacterium]